MERVVYLSSVLLCLLDVALPLPLESLGLKPGSLGLSGGGDHGVTGVLLVGVVLHLAHHGGDVTLDGGGSGGFTRGECGASGCHDGGGCSGVGGHGDGSSAKGHCGSLLVVHCLILRCSNTDRQCSQGFILKQVVLFTRSIRWLYNFRVAALRFVKPVFARNGRPTNIADDRNQSYKFRNLKFKNVDYFQRVHKFSEKYNEKKKSVFF